MNPDSFEAYLESLGYHGQAEGRFTIDPRQALAKLGAFQLPSPGLWAVKLVQGAVAAGASRVSFSLKRRSLEFRCFGEFEVTASALLRGVLQQEAIEDRATRHWLVALRAALGRGPDRLTITSCWQDEIQELEIRSGGLQTSLRRREGAFVYHRLAVLFEYADKHTNPTGDEFEELCQRGHLCPIPLVVNGRDIIRENLPYLSSLVVPAGAGEPGFDLFIKHQPGTESFHRFGDRVLGSGRHRASLFIGVARSKDRQRPNVYWSRDGALLGPWPVNGVQVAARLDIVLPGDDCELDLSEWGIRDMSAHFPAEKVRAALRQLAEFVPYVEQPKAPPPVAEKLFWGGVVMVCLLAAGPVVATLTMASGLVGYTVGGRTGSAPPSLVTALREAADATSLTLEDR